MTRSSKVRYGGCGEVVNTSDCGSDIRGFDSPHSPIFLGYSQAVRQGTLTPSCVGSNPATPVLSEGRDTDYGPLVKGLRHRLFTAVTRVRIPYGLYFMEDYPSPAEGNGLENRQACKSVRGFE